MTNMKICHLTTAHPRNDVRIFEKECISLADKVGYEVSLIVADGKGFEKLKGVSIHDIGYKKGRFKRFFTQPYRMLKHAYVLKANLYHFHDPELIFTGIILRLLGKKVIYDVHEDVPKSLIGREWLPKPFLKIISFTFKIIENILSRSFSGIITATASIESRFKKNNKNTLSIQNFPEFSTKKTQKVSFKTKNDICYIGAISRIRGIIPLLDALTYCDNTIRLHLAGAFINTEIEKEVRSHPNFSKVIYYGLIEREELMTIYKQSFAGLIPFLPLPNHIDAQPNKFFEYMAEGLPLIASDFPTWKEIIEENGIGFCVDPNNPKAIASAINHLYSNKDIASKMGEEGQELVSKKYNWDSEKKKLIKFYKDLSI